MSTSSSYKGPTIGVVARHEPPAEDAVLVKTFYECLEQLDRSITTPGSEPTLGVAAFEQLQQVILRALANPGGRYATSLRRALARYQAAPVDPDLRK